MVKEFKIVGGTIKLEEVIGTPLPVVTSAEIVPSQAQTPATFLLSWASENADKVLISGNMFTNFESSANGSEVINESTVGNHFLTITPINSVTNLVGNPHTLSYQVLEEVPLPSGFPVDLFLTPNTEATATVEVTIPIGQGAISYLNMNVYDADHGGNDPPEGHLFINGAKALDLFPGATQANGDGITQDVTYEIATSLLIDGTNLFKFVRLLSSGFRINSASVSFEVVIPPPPTGNLKYALIGDYGVDTPDELAVSQLINRELTTTVLTAGDNNYPRGEASTILANITQYFGDYIPSNFHPVPGNHDHRSGVGNGGLQPYLNYFGLTEVGGRSYYDFVENDIHFFCLDTGDNDTNSELGQGQEIWLQVQAAASTAKWKVVIMHHPPFSSGMHGSHPNLQLDYKAMGIDLVLAGHDHIYERIEKDGVTYIVSGLGGAGKYSFGTIVPGSVSRYNSEFGSFFIEPTPLSQKLDCKFVTTQNVIIDSFQLSKAVIPPSGDKHFGQIWTLADATVPMVDDIMNFNWSGLPRGSVVPITGTYNSTWNRPTGLDGLRILMKDLVFNGNGGSVEHAWYFANGITNTSFHSVDGNNLNALFSEFNGKIVDQHLGGGMTFDGFNMITPIQASQSDCFYFQDMKGNSINSFSFRVVNSRLIIRNRNSGAHCDLIQGFRNENDMLVWNVYGRNIENGKTSNAQGFFNELEGEPANHGTVEVQHCDIEVVRGGIVAVRNKNSTPRGHCIIRNNRVHNENGHDIWLNYPASWNPDIHTSNDAVVRIDS